MNTGMKADLSFSAVFRARWGNQCLCIILYRRSGQSTHKHKHTLTRTTARNVNTSRMHTNEHGLYSHTHTHTYTQNHFPLHCRNGSKGKGKIFHRLQCQPITLQVTSALLQSKPIRGDDELTLLSCLGPDLLLLCDTARGAACALHMGARVMHTHTPEAVRQPALFGSCWQKHFLPSWCFGIHQASAASSIIHNLSSVFPCLSACLCASACTCRCVSQCVCSVTICSHRIFGEPRSSLRISFFSLPPGTWARSCGHSQDRSVTLHSWTLFARCLVLSSSELWAWLDLNLAISLYLSASGSILLIGQNAWSKLSAVCLLGIYKGKMWSLIISVF